MNVVHVVKVCVHQNHQIITVRITLTETPRGEFYTPMLSERFFYDVRARRLARPNTFFSFYSYLTHFTIHVR